MRDRRRWAFFGSLTLLSAAKLTLLRRFRLGSMALTIFLANGIVPSASATSSIPNIEAIEDGVEGEAADRLRGDAGELRLEDVKSGRWLPPESEAINPLRTEALNESALTYGARAGLYARMREIHRMLDEEARALDQNFPFAPLMLAHNVTPPVIQSGRDTVRKHHDAQLQFADAVFTILTPAKLAVTPLDWRTYLYVRVARPEPPDETLLPNRGQTAEVALWERSVEKGWRRGVDQANRMFTIQLNRLERDLLGMALYRELLAKGMLTAPRLTEQLRGVTTDGPTLMVNDRLLEIVENTRFVANDQRWKPYPTRPYQPPKQRPKISLRILSDTPPAPAPASVVPVPSWEKAFWDR